MAMTDTLPRRGDMRFTDDGAEAWNGWTWVLPDTLRDATEQAQCRLPTCDEARELVRRRYTGPDRLADFYAAVQLGTDDDPDPDWLTRDQLAETYPDVSAVAEVLDEWLHRCHGVTSGSHYAGAFLDFLAAAGYRVKRIDLGPPLDQLLAPSKD